MGRVGGGSGLGRWWWWRVNSVGARARFVEGAPACLGIHVPESLFLRVGRDPVCMNDGAYWSAVGRYGVAVGRGGRRLEGG